MGSRAKGRDFQSRIARWMREKLGIGNYHSTQGMETARGNIGDVRLEEGGAPLNEGMVVQTKKGKQPSAWKAMRQAIEAADDEDLTPVAIVHRDRGSPKGTPTERLVCLTPEDFARLLGVDSDDLSY